MYKPKHLRRYFALMLAVIMTFGLIADMISVSASTHDASQATVATPAPLAAVSGSNYRNLSLNPGAYNSEMRFTWHSGSPTGSIMISPTVFHDVTFQGNGGEVVPAAITGFSSAESEQVWVLESIGTRVEAHHGVGAMGVTTNLQPTRPGFAYYLHQVSVYDLVPMTDYTYRVTWEGGESATKHFRTGGSDHFQFLIAGDPQIGTGDGLDPQGTAEATIDGREWDNALGVATAAYPNAEFVLSVGDQVHSSNHTNTANHVTISQYRHDRMFSSPHLHTLPMMGVVGNHDGWSFDDNNANTRLWPMHYNIPAPDLPGEVGGYNMNVFRHRGQFYTQFDYWVRWGNTFFMVLDSNGGNTTSERTMTGARLQFLQDAVAANADAEWMVATFHHPAFCVYRVSNAVEKTQIINNFLPRLEELNFDVILTGHAHVYNRTHQMIGAQSQLTQDWLDASGNVTRGEDATHAVLDPTGIVHFTFNSASGSGYYNVSFMPRSYISVYNQNFRRNFSVAEVTPHTFSVRTYQINNNGSHTLVDVYTIVRSENGGVPAAALPLAQMDDQIFERITPLENMMADHSPYATAEGLGLPTEVGIETNLFNNVGGNVANVRPPNAQAAPGSYGTRIRTPMVPVVWDVAGSGYNPLSTERQVLTITGTVAALPSGISNPNNVPLTTTIRVIVLPYGAVMPGDIARWMQADGMETLFVNAGGIAARLPNVSTTYGTATPLQFVVGNTTRMLQWNAGAPTVTTATVPGGTGGTGGLNNLDLVTQPARWETSFSTSGRAGIEVQFNFRSDPAGTGANNNGPRDWQLEFSLDGTTWLPAGLPIVLTGFWDNGIIRSLPAAADDQDNVYLRWRKISQTAVGGGEISATARNHMRDIVIRSTTPMVSDCLCGPDADCCDGECMPCRCDEALRIDVLLFSDFHGHVEYREPVDENPGAARLTAFIEHQRQQNIDPTNVIVVGGGDEFHGYAVSTLTRGEPALAMLGYLAENSYAQRDSGIHVAFGNHEFSFGYERAAEIGANPNVTLLAADLFYGPNHPRAGQQPDFVRAYDVIEFPNHDVTIALVGLMTSTMQGLISGWSTMGGGGLEFRTPAPNHPPEYTQAVADLIAYLRSDDNKYGQGVSAVIGVTHKPGNSPSMTYIANNLDFDAIVGGHQHVLVERTVNGVPIIEPQHHGRRLGRFSLSFDNDGSLIDVEASVSPNNAIRDFGLPQAHAAGVGEHYEAMRDIIAPFLANTYDELRGPRGPHGIYFDNRASRDVWASRLVLDYVVQWAKDNGEPEDWIGISNSGGWRNTGFWPRNADQQTTLAELISTMPFENNILLFRMHGADVLPLVNVRNNNGQLMSVMAGMHQVDDNWYVTSTGERILNDRSQIFNVIGSNFIFGGLNGTGGDNFPWPGNNQGTQMGMVVLDPDGPRVLMSHADGIPNQVNSTITWNQLLAVSDAPEVWEELGVSMIRTALLSTTDYRRVTPNAEWQAELTVRAAAVNGATAGTAVITSPFAPSDRSRNMNIIPQWVTVTAAANAGHRFVGWFNVGDADDAIPLSEDAVYAFTIREDTHLEARFEVGGTVQPTVGTIAAWASANLNASDGYPAITGAASFTPRWNEALGLVANPGNSRLNFVANGQRRVLAAGSGGINVTSGITGVNGSALNDLANNAYWITEISTIGRENISVDWSFRSTGTGPRDWQLQFSTDGGTNWHNAGALAVIENSSGNPANVNVGSHFNRYLPSAAEGFANVQIRWLLTSNSNVNGGTTVEGGTHQIGNILISSGEATPAPDYITVSEARALAAGQNVTVRGVVIDYYLPGAQGSGIFIQDPDSVPVTLGQEHNRGILVRVSTTASNSAALSLFKGQLVEVTGTRQGPAGVEGNGFINVANITATNGLAGVTTIEPAALPTPVSVTLQDLLNGRFQGMLVSIADPVRISGSTTGAGADPNRELADPDTGNVLAFNAAGQIVSNANNGANRPTSFILWPDPGAGAIDEDMQINRAVVHFWDQRTEVQLRLLNPDDAEVMSLELLRLCLCDPYLDCCDQDCAVCECICDEIPDCICDEYMGCDQDCPVCECILDGTGGMPGVNDDATDDTTDDATDAATDDDTTDDVTDNTTDDAADDVTDNATDDTTDDATDNATDDTTDNATDNTTDNATDSSEADADEATSATDESAETPSYGELYDAFSFIIPSSGLTTGISGFTPWNTIDVNLGHASFNTGLGSWSESAFVNTSYALGDSVFAVETSAAIGLFILRVRDGDTISTALPTAVREGYIFEGWNTAQDGSGTAFTGSTAINTSITVYAQWREESQDCDCGDANCPGGDCVCDTDCGDDSNGGGAPPPPLPEPPPYIPAPPTTSETPSPPPAQSAPSAPPTNTTIPVADGNVDVDVRVVGYRAAIQLDASTIREIIATDDNRVTFDLSDLDITSASVPRSAIRQFADAEMDIDIALPQGVISLSAEAVAVIAATAHTSNIVFRITALDDARVPAALAARMPEGATVHQVSISAGSRSIRTFNDAVVTVSLPFDSVPPVAVWRTGVGGSLIPVESEFNEASGLVSFDTNELGMFIVGRP